MADRIPQPVNLAEIEELAQRAPRNKPFFTSAYVLDLCHALRQLERKVIKLEAVVRSRAAHPESGNERAVLRLLEQDKA